MNKANHFWLDYSHFMAGINELYVMLWLQTLNLNNQLNNFL